MKTALIALYVLVGVLAVCLLYLVSALQDLLALLFPVKEQKHMRLVTYLLNNKPIRKVVVAALASGLVFLGRCLHVELGSQEATDAVSGLLPLIAAWATPDPRVQ